jgi:hypothetical protein
MNLPRANFYIRRRTLPRSRPYRASDLCALGSNCFKRRTGTAYFRRTDMRLEEHFESSSALQRNERVKLAATFWNNVGAGMVIGGMAAAFFLDKPPGTWTKIGIAIAGFVLGWLCYSIASNLLTYLHTALPCVLQADRAVGRHRSVRSGRSRRGTPCCHGADTGCGRSLAFRYRRRPPPVDDAGARAEPSQGLDDQREAVG